MAGIIRIWIGVLCSREEGKRGCVQDPLHLWVSLAVFRWQPWSVLDTSNLSGNMENSIQMSVQWRVFFLKWALYIHRSDGLKHRFYLIPPQISYFYFHTYLPQNITYPPPYISQSSRHTSNLHSSDPLTMQSFLPC